MDKWMDELKDSGKLNVWKIDGQMDDQKVNWYEWTWMSCSICKYEEQMKEQIDEQIYDGWEDGLVDGKF